jgi:hypothetical protein
MTQHYETPTVVEDAKLTQVTGSSVPSGKTPD